MSITSKPKHQVSILADEFEAYIAASYVLIPLYRWYDRHTVKTKAGKPVIKDGKPLIRLDGKRPLHKNWTTRNDYVSRDVLALCLKEQRNVGVRLTAAQLVVDVDPRNGGNEGFAKLCADLGLDPSGWPRVITGSGGWVKTGAGTLILANNGTYASETTIVAGAVELSEMGQLAQSPIVNHASFRTLAGDHAVVSVSGPGTTEVVAGSLTVGRLSQQVLSVGSGAKVVLAPSGESAAGGTVPVPEPAALLLLAIGLLGWADRCARERRASSAT